MDQFENPGTVIIAGRGSDEGRNFVSHLKNELSEKGWLVEAAISGSPIDLGKALRRAVRRERKGGFTCLRADFLGLAGC